MMRIPALALSVLLLLAATARAEDVIELESGRVLKGTIVRDEKAWVGIDTGEDVVWIERKEIAKLTRESGPAPQPASREEREKPVESTDEQPTPAPTRRRADPAPAPAASNDPPQGPREELTPEAEALRQRLASADRLDRAEATQWMIDTWPRWRPLVLWVLENDESEKARAEVVRVVDAPEICGDAEVVARALKDDGAHVRIAALRVARHREITSLEQRVIELMRTDSVWNVRMEAIRTLEDIGGAACLPHVMAAWQSETDKDRRRRYKRVMRTLLADEFGDDVDAWYRAADEVHMGYRVLRQGLVKERDER